MLENTGNFLRATLMGAAIMLLSACGTQELAQVEDHTHTVNPADEKLVELTSTKSGGPINFVKEINPLAKDPNTVIAITELSYPPFEMSDGKGGMEGFDIDLFNAIAEDQGFKVVYMNYAFDKLFEVLEDKPEVDVIVSCITKNEERAQKALLSDNYLTLGTAIAVKADNDRINTALDLKGKTISFLKDTIFKQEFDEVFKGDFNAVETDSHFLAIREVVLGKADAVVADAGVLTYNLKNLGVENIRVFRDVTNLPTHETVFAVKKNKPELVEKINKGIANLKKNGKYDEIYKKWLTPYNVK